MTADASEDALNQPSAGVDPGIPRGPLLAEGLEFLVQRLADRPRKAAAPSPADAHPGAGSPLPPEPVDFDLIIVGSGYGAAVSARMFAGCRPAGADATQGPLSICILERGLEYLRGSFPTRAAELAGHVRFSSSVQAAPQGVRTGLFDVRVGGDVMALVANGVGGGSLINAGVMLRAGPDVMKQAPWPAKLRRDRAIDRDYDVVQQWLGAGTRDEPNTVVDEYAKTRALECLSGGRKSAVPITVATRSGTRSVAGVPLEACIGCGDCATGCNHGAKISLDVGLLAQACATPGVELYSGATVLRLEKLPNDRGWAVDVQHTHETLRRRQGTPFRVTAKRVILAAGSLGSTEILLRSQAHGLSVSSMVGRRFSTNGDLIASVHGLNKKVDAIADEDVDPSARKVGPTITAMIDLREPASHEAGAAAREKFPPGPFLIQDLAVPGPMRRIFEELYTTAATLHGLQSPEGAAEPERAGDPCAVDPAVNAHSLPVAMIGHDAADGLLRLLRSPGTLRRTDPPSNDEGDGALRIEWPSHKRDPRWPAQHAQLDELLRKSGLGGWVLPNPAWQLLPARMQSSLGVPLGAGLTVHPLGGCPMGDTLRDGAVNHIGQVFDATDPNKFPKQLHQTLVVLDGAIVPTSLGVNPALTIAALAHRAALRLREEWGLGEAVPATDAQPARPAFRQLAPVQPARPTQIELSEQMRGKARFADGVERWVELTLYSKPTDLRDLMSANGERKLNFDPARSRFRIYREIADQTAGAAAKEIVDIEGPLKEGSLTLFEQSPVGEIRGRWRTLAAFCAWLVNRGVRDIVQRGRERGLAGFGLWRMAKDSWHLARHASAARTLTYRFTIEPEKGVANQTPMQKWFAQAVGNSAEVRGVKKLAYGLASNPFAQLISMTLLKFPGVKPRTRPVLSLHFPFLAAQAVPLIRIVRQQDQPTALIDLASFAAYVSRILVDTQLWCFRKPDAASAREPQRLPGVVPGAPLPQVTELEVARRTDSAGRTTPVHIRLTRYCRPDARTDLPPVLMIHGYSASGTTFAHSALDRGLMPYLCDEPFRRDVWILDMRSSCGMPTASDNWSFEDMGCEDIPVAVEHVCQATGSGQVDVVAHCMGVAMLFMGLLGKEGAGQPSLGGHEVLRRKLWDRNGAAPNPPAQENSQPGNGGRIRRLVMSQVGPAVQLTPANIARSYLMRYAKQFVQGAHYEFRPGREAGLATELLDRLLAAMPYPPGEFELENPFWPPGKRLSWVGSRHRIDALFGRVFNLGNVSAEVLEHIDDFFGPFNVDTVSQVMHFARHQRITDRHGFSRFATPEHMSERLTFPMLSLHSADNGLADVGTKDALARILAPSLGDGGTLRSEVFRANHGHQDALIGKTEVTAPVFKAISDFLMTSNERADHANTRG